MQPSSVKFPFVTFNASRAPTHSGCSAPRGAGGHKPLYPRPGPPRRGRAHSAPWWARHALPASARAGLGPEYRSGEGGREERAHGGEGRCAGAGSANASPHPPPQVTPRSSPPTLICTHIQEPGTVSGTGDTARAPPRLVPALRQSLPCETVRIPKEDPSVKGGYWGRGREKEGPPTRPQGPCSEKGGEARNLPQFPRL